MAKRKASNSSKRNMQTVKRRRALAPVQVGHTLTTTRTSTRISLKSAAKRNCSDRSFPKKITTSEIVIPSSNKDASIAVQQANKVQKEPEFAPIQQLQAKNNSMQRAALKGQHQSVEISHVKPTEQFETGRWKKEQDERLREGVAQIGAKNWKQISAEFLRGARSEVQCLHRWTKVLQPGLKKGKWKDEEDAAILHCIAEGMTNWTDIADQIPGRVGKQCRERWANHLDPTLKKGNWTKEEDEVLMGAQELIGNKWCEISKIMPGRSENAIKNRWNSTMRKNLVKDWICSESIKQDVAAKFSSINQEGSAKAAAAVVTDRKSSVNTKVKKSAISPELQKKAKVASQQRQAKNEQELVQRAILIGIDCCNLYGHSSDSGTSCTSSSSESDSEEIESAACSSSSSSSSSGFSVLSDSLREFMDNAPSEAQAAQALQTELRHGSHFMWRPTNNASQTVSSKRKQQNDQNVSSSQSSLEPTFTVAIHHGELYSSDGSITEDEDEGCITEEGEGMLHFDDVLDLASSTRHDEALLIKLHAATLTPRSLCC
jgi:hypothetical protein